ncbi:flagellar filament capping protein FliD [Pseudocolwellia sp. HL-MZ7]|uniref:flagellar filament capping protein FliD n=1 Tax=Pseudocolwellia sp. HL-MZ7 TaxID=3400627 RepID=UPI003CE94ED4
MGSGLEVSEIVDALVGAERTPYESRATAKAETLTTDISAVGALKSALEVVQVSMASLADADNYQQRSVSGSDDFVSLSSDETAEVGSYAIKVDALATEHKLSSIGFEATDAVGEGTITFNSGGNSFDITTTDTDTLADLRDAINDSNDNDSITATIVTGVEGQHLVLTSNETGLESGISITVNESVDAAGGNDDGSTDDGGLGGGIIGGEEETEPDTSNDANNVDNIGLSRLAYQPNSEEDGFSTNMTEVTAASDAQITLDGNIVATSSSNTFTNVIDGIDITVNKIHNDDDDSSSANVTEDNSNIESGLDSFVSSYNTLIELADNLAGVGDDGVGVMTGDALLRGVLNKLRQEISNSFDTGSGNTLSLSALGVSGDIDGVLSLDSDILNDFIDSDVDAVEQFFTGDNTSSITSLGFAQSMDDLLNFYTASDGLIEGRIDSKESQLTQLEDDNASFLLKMDALEARLLSQFNAMDLLVANLNSTSTYLQAQLDNMPGVVLDN